MNQKLNTEKAEILISQLPDLVALNLAHNHLNNVPRSLPPSLIALDLSFNEFKAFPATYRLRNLVELKLSNNLLDSIVGLSVATSLEYLDVSNNRITKIRGLEMCSKLKLLHADNNNISSPSALRSLSLNTMLIDLSLRGNPLCITKTYKTNVMAFVTKLKTLDGKVVSHRSHKLDVGYTDSRSYVRQSEEYDDVSSTSGVSWRPRGDRPRSGSSSRYGRYNRPSSIHSNERVYIDGWSTGADQDPFSVIRHRSPVPWRNPPQIVPRDRRGNPVMSVQGVGISSDHNDVSRLLINNSIQSIPSYNNSSFYATNPNDLSRTSNVSRQHHHLPSSPNTSREHHNNSPSRSGSSSRRGRSLSPAHNHRTSSAAHRSRSMATGMGRHSAAAAPSSSPTRSSLASHSHSNHRSQTAGTGTYYRDDYSNNQHRSDPPSTIRANRRQPHGSPGRSVEYGTTHWSSPSLQRKQTRAENHSIMEKFPLSPTSRGNGQQSMSSRHSLSHSRSLLNDSNSSMGDVGDRGGAATHSHHPHHSHHPRHAHNSTVVSPDDVLSYGPVDVDDNEEIYLAADMDNDSTLDKISLTLGLERPSDQGDPHFLEQLGSLGSRLIVPGPGSDVSSALAFLEDMWHEGDPICYLVQPNMHITNLQEISLIELTHTFQQTNSYLPTLYRPSSEHQESNSYLDPNCLVELIAQAKNITIEEQHTLESDHTSAVSSTLQNRSALLRAIYNAERLRERKMSEQDEERKRQPSALTTGMIAWLCHPLPFTLPTPIMTISLGRLSTNSILVPRSLYLPFSSLLSPLPRFPFHSAEVDWDHHHSGGKTPPYHRMHYHKAGATTGGGGVGLGHRQGQGHAHVYGSPENSSGKSNTSGSEEERYDKILSRAKEYANGGIEGTGLVPSQQQQQQQSHDRPVTVGNNNNNNNNNNSSNSNNSSNNSSPTQPTSTNRSYKSGHDDRRNRTDVYHSSDTSAAATTATASHGSGNGSGGSPGYAIYGDDGGVVISGSQDDQRLYGVPLPVLPTLNRSNTNTPPPDPLKSRTSVRTTNEQENNDTGVRHAPIIDSNVTIHAMLKDMHRHSFRDDTLIGDFDELEKLLITSQEIDDNDNANVSSGSLPTIGIGNSADEIARLRGKYVYPSLSYLIL